MGRDRVRAVVRSFRAAVQLLRLLEERLLRESRARFVTLFVGRADSAKGCKDDVAIVAGRVVPRLEDGVALNFPRI